MQRAKEASLSTLLQCFLTPALLIFRVLRMCTSEERIKPPDSSFLPSLLPHTYFLLLFSVTLSDVPGRRRSVNPASAMALSTRVAAYLILSLYIFICTYMARKKVHRGY